MHVLWQYRYASGHYCACFAILYVPTSVSALCKTGISDSRTRNQADEAAWDGKILNVEPVDAKSGTKSTGLGTLDLGQNFPPRLHGQQRGRQARQTSWQL